VTRAFATSAQRLASSAATYIKAVSWATEPITTVAIVGDADSARDLLGAALRTYRPRTVVRRIDPAESGDVALPPELRAMVTAESPRAYVCAGTVCAAPVDEPDALVEILRTFHG
jgi:uncharacterized protein YyaL (SSP411 family)